MLQFFKRTGIRDRSKSSQSSPTKSTSSDKSGGSDAVIVGCSLSRPVASRSLEEEEEEDDDEIRDSLKIEISSARSRLSKTLAEILADKEALGYFIQFMESRGKLALIKFWMEVECVREASHESNDLIVNINLSDILTEFELKSDGKDNCLRETARELNGINNDDTGDAPVNYPDIVNINDLKINCKESKISFVSTNCKSISEEPDEMSSIIQDALRIHKKYIRKDALRINEISSTFKTKMEKASSSQDAAVLIKGLLIAQRIVYKVLEEEYIEDFLRSEFHCKHQIDVLTSGDVKLADILFNETAFFYFMEFMELENKRELLDFWMSVVNYKQNFLEERNADPMEAQADALIIYERFFSLQATMPLGFTDKIRFEVEQNICREGGDGPQSDCFDKPSMIVYNFMSKHYLPAFLSSQLYYKYLSELISTIQSGACASQSHQRLKRAGSDCSSEMSIFSISAHDTSHTSNNDEGNRTSRDNTINGMNIDTRQLYDPDSLWKRNKYNLSVGYVDSMGRFVTEIEPDPHRKYESRLSRAVKRLIHLEEDKAKEELAWKIAEMIIREITSLTLGAPELPP